MATRRIHFFSKRDEKLRFYEKLENFYKNHDVNGDFSSAAYIVDYLATNNQFISLQEIRNFSYGGKSDSETSYGAYNYPAREITITDFMLQSLENKDVNILDLFNTVYHEQRHNSQFMAARLECTTKYYEHVDTHKFAAALLSRRLNKEEVAKLKEYATKNKIIKSEKQFTAIEFGSYLAEDIEIDARAVADDQTLLTVKKIVNDPDCPLSLKQKLNNDLKAYIKKEKERNKTFQHKMDAYLKFEMALKEAIKKATPDDHKLTEKQLDEILDDFGSCQFLFNEFMDQFSQDEQFEIYVQAVILQKTAAVSRFISRKYRARDFDAAKKMFNLLEKHDISNLNLLELKYFLLNFDDSDECWEWINKKLDTIRIKNGDASYFLSKLSDAMRHKLEGDDRHSDYAEPDDAKITRFANAKEALNVLINKLKTAPSANLIFSAKADVVLIKNFVKTAAQYSEHFQFNLEEDYQAFCNAKFDELNDLIAQNEHLLEPQTDEPLGV